MQIVILEFSSANGSKIPIDGPRRYLALSEEIRISLTRSKKSQCKKISDSEGDTDDEEVPVGTRPSSGSLQDLQVSLRLQYPGE